MKTPKYYRCFGSRASAYCSESLDKFGARVILKEPMSVKEALKSSSAKLADVSPAPPAGVRIVVTRERSASEVSREADLVFDKRKP